MKFVVKFSYRLNASRENFTRNFTRRFTHMFHTRVHAEVSREVSHQVSHTVSHKVSPFSSKKISHKICKRPPGSIWELCSRLQLDVTLVSFSRSWFWNWWKVKYGIRNGSRLSFAPCAWGLAGLPILVCLTTSKWLRRVSRPCTCDRHLTHVQVEALRGFPDPVCEPIAAESESHFASEGAARVRTRNVRSLRRVNPLLSIVCFCCVSSCAVGGLGNDPRHSRKVFFAHDRPLRYLDLAPKALERFSSALKRYSFWLKKQALHPVTPSEHDDALELYINDIFKKFHGKYRQSVVDVFAAVQRRWPELKGSMRASTAALKPWQKLDPYRSYKPVSQEVCFLVTYYLSGSGWWLTGTACLMGSYGLCRVGEVLRLRAQDVTFHRSRGKAVAVLRLQMTKTGRNKPVRIDDVGCIWALKVLKQWVQTAGGDLLFGHTTYYRILAQLRPALTYLNLPPNQFTFHTLRLGGATFLYLHGRSLDTIAHHGRWASRTTARRYIQQGMALLGGASAWPPPCLSLLKH